MNDQKKTSILIVDDNETLVKSLVMNFKSADFDVSGCSNPVKILNQTNREEAKLDLILLDMYLGVINGEYLNAPGLIPHLRILHPFSKIVIYSSGDIDTKLCLRCLELGALAILPKTTVTTDLISIAKVYAEIGDPNKTR
jgi:DNA-binding NtrC family response regulator